MTEEMVEAEMERVRLPACCAVFSLSCSPLHALAPQVKTQLRQRGLSLVTPGCTGAPRLHLLRLRLSEALHQEEKAAAEAKKPTSATRQAAFKAFRLDQVPHLSLGALFRCCVSLYCKYALHVPIEFERVLVSLFSVLVLD